MKRTTEKTLGIISIVLNALAIFSLIIVILIGAFAKSDPYFLDEIENELYADDPTLTEEEVDEILDITTMFFSATLGFVWILVITTIAAIVLSIIATVQVNKKPKNAGIMYLIASFLSIIISIQGILLLIAGLLCLVRKPDEPIEQTTITVQNNENQINS